jgi:hypothetical protein
MSYQNSYYALELVLVLMSKKLYEANQDETSSLRWIPLYKEAEETEYWLELLTMSNYLDYDIDKLIIADCKELCKILNSIVKITKSSNLK